MRSIGKQTCCEKNKLLSIYKDILYFFIHSMVLLFMLFLPSLSNSLKLLQLEDLSDDLTSYDVKAQIADKFHVDVRREAAGTIDNQRNFLQLRKQKTCSKLVGVSRNPNCRLLMLLVYGHVCLLKELLGRKDYPMTPSSCQTTTSFGIIYKQYPSSMKCVSTCTTKNIQWSQ